MALSIHRSFTTAVTIAALGLLPGCGDDGDSQDADSDSDAGTDETDGEDDSGTDSGADGSGSGDEGGTGSTEDGGETDSGEGSESGADSGSESGADSGSDGSGTDTGDPCSMYGNMNECDAVDMCNWVNGPMGGCKSDPTGCGDAQDEEACNDLVGCTWMGGACDPE